MAAVSFSSCSIVVPISLPSLTLEQEFFFQFGTEQRVLVGEFAQRQRNNELAAIYEQRLYEICSLTLFFLFACILGPKYQTEGTSKDVARTGYIQK